MGSLRYQALLLLSLTLLLNPLAVSAFEVEPANVTDEELEEIIKNDVDDEKKITFWELPLWIKIDHIIFLTVSTLSAVGIGKFLPFVLTRIKSILHSEKRQQIIDYVQYSPGASIKELEDALDVNRSTLRYHLRILEMRGLVFSRTVGKERLLFQEPLPDSEVNRIAALKSETRKKILELLTDNGELSTKDIAQELGLSPKTVHHHLHILQKCDAIKLTREGQNTVKMNDVSDT
ncbi:MAG: helix-turn-helix domain-containing protein [Archaeoglobaceae archaeon]